MLIVTDISKNSNLYAGQVETYLEPSRTYTIELFCENGENTSTKRAPPYMFDRVLNTPLVLTIKYTDSTITAEFWFILELRMYFFLLKESKFSNFYIIKNNESQYRKCVEIPLILKSTRKRYAL